MQTLTLVDVNPMPTIGFGPSSGPTLTLVDLTPSIDVGFADPTAISLQLATVFKGDVGPEGPQGPQGIQGPVGPALTPFSYQQSAPASTWAVQHDLGRRPSVTTTDAQGNVFYGAVDHVSDAYLTVNFARPVSGYAYLN